MQTKSTIKNHFIRVVAGLIINSEGKGLIAKRSQRMSSPGLWEIPGGKVETGEVPRVALRRELQEELSVNVVVGEHFASTQAVISGKSFQMNAYRCFLLDGHCQATEHEALRWICAEDVGGLEWAPLDIPMLPEIKQLLWEAAQRGP